MSPTDEEFSSPCPGIRKKIDSNNLALELESILPFMENGSSLDSHILAKTWARGSPLYLAPPGVRAFKSATLGPPEEKK